MKIAVPYGKPVMKSLYYLQSFEGLILHIIFSLISLKLFPEKFSLGFTVKPLSSGLYGKFTRGSNVQELKDGVFLPGESMEHKVQKTLKI